MIKSAHTFGFLGGAHTFAHTLLTLFYKSVMCEQGVSD